MGGEVCGRRMVEGEGCGQPQSGGGGQVAAGLGVAVGVQADGVELPVGVDVVGAAVAEDGGGRRTDALQGGGVVFGLGQNRPGGPQGGGRGGPGRRGGCQVGQDGRDVPGEGRLVQPYGGEDGLVAGESGVEEGEA